MPPRNLSLSSTSHTNQKRTATDSRRLRTASPHTLIWTSAIGHGKSSYLIRKMARKPRKVFRMPIRHAWFPRLCTRSVRWPMPFGDIPMEDDRFAAGGINMGLSCALCLNVFSLLLGRYVDRATWRRYRAILSAIWATHWIKGLTLFSGNMWRCLDCTTLESAPEQAYLHTSYYLCGESPITGKLLERRYFCADL